MPRPEGARRDPRVLRLVVLEHFSARPRGADPASLRRAGGALLRAVAADFADLPGVRVTTVPASRRPAVRFARRLRHADAALVIAPENDRILERWLRAVRQAGVRLIGPGPHAAHLAADKLATFRLLARAGIPTPRTEAIPWHAARRRLARRPPPFILKPRHGCGAEGVSLVRRSADLAPALRRVRAATRRSDLIVQDWVEGEAASIALLVHDAHRRRAAADHQSTADRRGAGDRHRTGDRNRAAGSHGAVGRVSMWIVSLPLARQRIGGRRALRYLGGEVPWRHARGLQAARLARRAIAALAAASGDLRGFVGVDLVLGARGAQVIEINPRLTSSYLGLRDVITPSPARLMLSTADGARPPHRHRAAPGPVVCRGHAVFTAGGHVRLGPRRRRPRRGATGGRRVVTAR
jgi:predicted ATP-grasp superfamily ATP-dependent carboligase